MTKLLLIPVLLLSACAFGETTDVIEEARRADALLKLKYHAVVCGLADNNHVYEAINKLDEILANLQTTVTVSPPTISTYNGVAICVTVTQ